MRFSVLCRIQIEGHSCPFSMSPSHLIHSVSNSIGKLQHHLNYTLHLHAVVLTARGTSAGRLRPFSSLYLLLLTLWPPLYEYNYAHDVRTSAFIFTAFLGECAGVPCEGVLCGVLFTERRSVVPCLISARSLSIIHPSCESGIWSVVSSFKPAETESVYSV